MTGDPFAWNGEERRDDAALEAIIERAAERGAKKALASVGLHDDNAGTDVRDLRSVLEAWRTVKKTVLVTLARAATVGFLALLAIGTWFYIGKK